MPTVTSQARLAATSGEEALLITQHPALSAIFLKTCLIPFRWFLYLDAPNTAPILYLIA
jgi:hypothetical protein